MVQRLVLSATCTITSLFSVPAVCQFDHDVVRSMRGYRGRQVWTEHHHRHSQARKKATGATQRQQLRRTDASGKVAGPLTVAASTQVTMATATAQQAITDLEAE
eukprot:6201395-Prymnesium_polylepis.2